MRSVAPKTISILALTGVFAALGANGILAMPLHHDRAAPGPSRLAIQVPAPPDALIRRPAGARDGIAVDELMKGHAQGPGATSSARLIHLRPASPDVSTEKRLADVGALEATPGGRPIGDVYDFTGVSAVEPRPITPRTTMRRIRVPEVRIGSRPIEPPRTYRPLEARQWNPPEPPLEREPEQPVPSNDALDLGIKTLDYVVMATRILVEFISRNIADDR